MATSILSICWYAVRGIVAGGWVCAQSRGPCLQHVVVGNDILMRVIQAVTKNGVSLLNVAMLVCVGIWTYGAGGGGVL
jgi:hypothetical protein